MTRVEYIEIEVKPRVYGLFRFDVENVSSSS